MLVTDHSALQWAQAYKNVNRRLAAWGAVFSVFAPNLGIVHRAGRVHSNVDPLSQLPRAPPPQTSSVKNNRETIRTNESLVEAQEQAAEQAPAKKATFVAWAIENCLEDQESIWSSVFSVTRDT
jgi:hypothetical protein